METPLLLLAAASAAVLPSEKAALADPKDATHPVNVELAFSASMKPKIIDFPLSRSWLRLF